MVNFTKTRTMSILLTRKRAGNVSRFGSAVIAVALLASACRVVGGIEAGRKVSINPCDLVSLEKAESVLQASLFQQLAVSHSRDKPAAMGQCVFGPRSSGEGPTLSVLVEGTTVGELPTSDGSQTVRGVGREARYRYIDGDEPNKALRLLALTDKGAKLTFLLSDAAADGESLLEKTRAIAAPAVAKAEQLFPGTAQPPRDDPPVPICEVVGQEKMVEIYGGFWQPPAGKSLVLIESEFFGGSEVSGFGPVGGGWACRSDVEPHVYGGAGEDYHPHTAWWISKSRPAEPDQGSQPVRRLGASATFKVVDESWYFGSRSFVLSVVSNGGHHLEVDVDLTEMDDSVGRDVALAVAGRLLERLP